MKGVCGMINLRKPFFIIQKHKASHLHYDFRLYVNGVLKSWALPKGPTLNPNLKRLAISTEDHLLSYANFEGIIPHHHYGGGIVLMWDQGPYKNITFKNGQNISMKEALQEGHILFQLKGQKLKGNFILQRLQEEKWLLIKKQDEYASQADILNEFPASVISHKTIEDFE
ncbi:MAG: DNA ligase [Proteobacteria bacterium]|nr:DNA ligase [Pseudomonadota bacterium]